MTPHEYIEQIQERLFSSDVVISFSLVESWVLLSRGYVRIRLRLLNEDFVELAELFQIIGEQHIAVRYRYQWMDAAQQQLRRRWDNARHFRNLRGFPHHVHIGTEIHVEPSRELSILDVLDMIEQLFLTAR